MKNAILIGLLLAFFSQSSSATRYDVEAEVGRIRYHEATNMLNTNWSKIVWFELKNPNITLVNCPIYEGGVIISIPEGNDVAISMLISAKMANKKVLVTIDDAVKFPANERCKLQYITIL